MNSLVTFFFALICSQLMIMTNFTVEQSTVVILIAAAAVGVYYIDCKKMYQERRPQSHYHYYFTDQYEYNYNFDIRSSQYLQQNALGYH